MFVAKAATAIRRALLAACVLEALQSFSFAAATFSSSSTAKWTFDPDTSGGTQLKVINVNPPPASSAMPVPPAFQLNQTFIKGKSSSTAKGSIGFVVNPTTATFTLSPGTGVTQSDPNNAAYPGDSLLRVDFDGLFNPTSPGFGPPATGYVSVAVGGIVGVGGSSRFTGQVQYLNGLNNTALRPTANFNQLFSTPGSFSKVFTSSSFLNPLTIPVGTPIHVKGFFEFRASNAGSPSSITPLDIDFGSAPPTATWFGKDGGEWTGAGNWQPPRNSSIDDPQNSIPVSPNGVGQRARFPNLNKSLRTIDLNANITLGALDFGRNSDLTIGSGNGSRLTFDTQSGDATIQARNLGTRSSTKTIDAGVIFADNLSIFSDSEYVPDGSSRLANLVFKRPIIGRGASGIEKIGGGQTTFNAPNKYKGGTTISEGTLFANVAGSLGSGAVTADSGQINYNARRAAAKGVTVTALNGGQIDLGIVPQLDENFVVQGPSAISGDRQQLSALVNGGNVLLSPGAMIAHERWDTTAAGNPKGLGKTPNYIFGLANDFADDHPHSITVGSESATPWVGFGSDRSDRSFGQNTKSDRDVINVQGKAELISLNQLLTLNARLVSVGNSSGLTKVGSGAVAIDSRVNAFHAPIHAVDGTLLVDGVLPKLPGMDIRSGATLGGLGIIDGPVMIGDGATLAPGHIKSTQKTGTLTVKDLTLDRNSILDFDLDSSDIIGRGVNDLVVVKGDLTLAGTINIFDAGNFTATGRYTLFQVDGKIDTQAIHLGIVPDGLRASLNVVPGINGEGNAVVLDAEPIAAPSVIARMNSTSLAPEPASAGALFIAGMLLSRRTRLGRRRWLA